MGEAAMQQRRGGETQGGGRWDGTGWEGTAPWVGLRLALVAKHLAHVLVGRSAALLDEALADGHGKVAAKDLRVQHRQVPTRVRPVVVADQARALVAQVAEERDHVRR